MEGSFAATPSTTAVRTALFVAALRGLEVMVADVQTAFLHAPVAGAGGDGEPIFIRPPRPVAKPGVLWELNRALYGLRRAPALWQSHLVEVMKILGFSPTQAEPCLFQSSSREMLIVAHVDDLLAVGSQKAINKFQEDIQKHLTVK